MICGKRTSSGKFYIFIFYYQSYLIQIHTRIHTRCKPFHCHICGKNFSVHGNRNDHMRRHVSLKPYKCPISGCNSAYYRKYQLVSHGHSLKHRHLPDGLFALLLSNMPAPDLKIDMITANQELHLQKTPKTALDVLLDEVLVSGEKTSKKKT